MRIYLTQVPNLNSAITSQDVISAYITQKLDNGYLVNIGGTEVFAHSLLNFNVGDFLKLKRVESVTSQIIFKVIDHERESHNISKPITHSDIQYNQEVQTAFKLLSKLNLPIIKERVALVTELLNHLTNEKKSEPSLLSSNELQTSVSSFREAMASYIENGIIVSENQLLEFFENFTTSHENTAVLKEKNNERNLDKALPNSKAKETVLKELLALKAINLLHDDDPNNKICFFQVSIPVYHNVYLKVSKKRSNDNTESISLSFIINTKNLGAVLIDLMYRDGRINASSTFEDKKAMNSVKKLLNGKKDIPSIIRTMKLKIGKVSKKDFFLGDIKKYPITTGINIKV